MKKVLTIVICLIMALPLSLTASAASASVSGASTITEGGSAQYTVSISGCSESATSVSVSISVGENLSIESGSWLKTASSVLNNPFDQNTNKGAIAYSSASDINGAVYRLSIKGDKQSINAQSISVAITAKNGANEIFNQSSSTSVTVTCASHKYGNYEKANDNQHTRTCSACGNKETTNHTWNSGTILKQATCKESGACKYVCSICNAETTKQIPQTTNHTIGAYKTTKQPTCTEKGEETAACSTCGQTVKKAIPATGHQFSKWANEKEPTCTEKGIKKRVCERCKTEENQNIDALGHDFDNPTVIKEATLYTSGLIEGKCKRCGEKTQEVVPCYYQDKTNNIKLETSEGVFTEGTEIKITTLKKDSEDYNKCKNELLKLASKFKIFDINAIKDNKIVQPNGLVRISFNDISKIGKDIEVYYRSTDGSFVKLDMSVSEDGNTVSIDTNKLGVFAICTKADDLNSEKPTIKLNDNNKKYNTKKLIIYICIIAVLASIGAAAFIIFSKKKRY